MKKLLLTLAFFVPSLVFAVTSVPWQQTNLTDTFFTPALVNGINLGLQVKGASSTLQNFTFVNATGTQSTTTRFAIIGVTGCNTSSALTTNSSGSVVCGAISGSGTVPGGADTQVQFNDANAFGGSAFLTFTKSNGLLTSLSALFTNASTTNFLATGSSTLQNFTALNSTSTNATTTNSFSTTASSTNLWAQVAKVGTLSTSGLGTLSSLSVTGSATLNGSLVDSAASAGTGGYVLMSTGNTVQWVATSTLSNATAYKTAVKYATTAALPANTYANGSGGVGATISEIGVGALSVDSASPVVGDRVLIKNEGTAANNGIYTVTAAGSGIASFILTRATDYNTSLDVFPGVANYVTSGTVSPGNLNTTWVMTSDAPITIGTTALNYSPLSQDGSDFTACSVIFSDGTLFAQNNAHLCWKDSLTGLGIGTSTPRWKLQIATSTAAQLTLSDPSTLTNNHWSFRNAGGNFYLATSSPIGNFATSTTAIFSIDPNGQVTFSNHLIVLGNATVTNATSTNHFSTTASSTNLFSTNANFGLVTMGNATSTTSFATTASSTNLFSTNANLGLATLGNATSTTLFATTASTTNLYLATGGCSGSNALGVSAGKVVCGAVSGSGSASTTLLTDNNAFTGLNTFTDLQAVTRSTTTQATTTTASFTTASTTNLTVSGVKSSFLVTNANGTVAGGTATLPTAAGTLPVILGSSGTGSTITQSVTEVNLAAIKIPAGTMGTNGRVNVRGLFKFVGTTATKNIKVRLSTSSGDTSAGTLIVDFAPANTALSYYFEPKDVWNSNSASAQVFYVATGGGVGNNVAAPSTAAINTANDAYININGFVTNAADSEQLVGYTVELFPSF